MVTARQRLVVVGGRWQRPRAPERHDDLFALCARLLRGDVLEFVDDLGREWQATATDLEIRLPLTHEIVAALSDLDAFEVAEKVVQLELNVRPALVRSGGG